MSRKNLFILSVAAISLTSVFSSAIAQTELEQKTQIDDLNKLSLVQTQPSRYSLSASFGAQYNHSFLQTNDLFAGYEDVKTYGASPQPIIEFNAKVFLTHINNKSLSYAGSLLVPIVSARIINDENNSSSDPISIKAMPMLTNYFLVVLLVGMQTQLTAGLGGLITKCEIINEEYQEGIHIKNAGSLLAVPYMELGLLSKVRENTNVSVRIYYAHDIGKNRTFDDAKNFFGTGSLTYKSTLQYIVTGTLLSVERTF